MRKDYIHSLSLLFAPSKVFFYKSNNRGGSRIKIIEGLVDFHNFYVTYTLFLHIIAKLLIAQKYYVCHGETRHTTIMLLWNFKKNAICIS